MRTRGAAPTAAVTADPPVALFRLRDLAGGRPATASSAAAGAEAGKAVDSDPATHWTSAAGDAAPWWQVDLGAVQWVHRVAVAWEPVYGSAYDVQVSRDAQTLRAVAEVTVNAAQDVRTTIPSRRARYGRIGVRTRTGASVAFGEVGVMGLAGGAAPPRGAACDPVEAVPAPCVDVRSVVRQRVVRGVSDADVVVP